MNAIMVIGGDHLGNIREKLEGLGYQDVMHIKGRKESEVKFKIPKKVKMLLIFTDYVNHNLAKKMKAKAKERDLPIVFTRRSWSDIHSSLNELKIS